MARSSYQRSPRPLAHPPSPRRRPSPIGRVIGWIGVMVAIVAVFVGGAGFVMIAAGHINATALAVAAAAPIGAAYLGWFLMVGPGTGASSAGERVERRADPADASKAATTVRLGPPGTRSSCGFCSRPESPGNRLVWGTRAAICERCLADAAETRASRIADLHTAGRPIGEEAGEGRRR